MEILPEDTTLDHAGRVAGQVHRHRDGDPLAAADHQEVDVDVGAADRVALDFAGQGQVALPAEPQGDQCVGPAAAQGLAELALVDRQVLGVDAVAVEDRRHAAVRAGSAGGSLPGVRALVCRELVLGHGERASLSGITISLVGT